jgi:1,2-diacylglycerol 3-alpha-glucosyltransferase
MNTLCALLYGNLGPYHIARLRALSPKLPDIIAMEIACEQKLYPWRPARDDMGFRHVTLFQKPFESVSAAEQKAAVTKALEAIRPSSVVVAGYFDPCMRAASKWARHNAIPCIMTTTTTAVDKRRFRLKEALKGFWCRKYYSALCLPGEKSVEYFTRLRYPSHLMWRCPNTVDNAFFESATREVTAEAERIRTRLQLPERYFLTVARLSPEKSLISLLKAFSDYRERGGNWDLVIVGSGPQEPELRGFARDRNLEAAHFVSWKQHYELPAYYALASCFVLPSISEPWGLVVNEAMACGLPVLVSRRCGCQPELARRGVNGFDFDPYNVDELTKLLLRCSGDEMDLVAMGKQSLKIIANYTPETWALSFKDCIFTCLAKATR